MKGPAVTTPDTAKTAVGVTDPRPEIGKLDATPTKAQVFLDELESANSELTESIDELAQGIDALRDNLEGEAGEHSEALKAEQQQLREVIDTVELIIDELDRALEATADRISSIASDVAPTVAKVLDGQDGTTEESTKITGAVTEIEKALEGYSAQIETPHSKLTSLKSQTGGGVDRGGDGD